MPHPCDYFNFFLTNKINDVEFIFDMLSKYCAHLIIFVFLFFTRKKKYNLCFIHICLIEFFRNVFLFPKKIKHLIKIYYILIIIIIRVAIIICVN